MNVTSRDSRRVAHMIIMTFVLLLVLLIIGQGAAGNYDFLRTFWSDSSGTKGLLIDDSGPILDDTAIAPCLEALWRKSWNMNDALPTGCPCIGDKGGLVEMWNFTKSKWPSDSFGLISTLDDSVISLFFSYGDLDCLNPIPIGYTKLAGGLRRLAAGGVASYLITGSEHTHTGDKSEFYTKQSEGVLLYKWITELLGAGSDPPSVIPK